MSTKQDNLYSGLKKIFHEPSRLAIMSVLSGSIEPVTFVQLKEECELTDGNLSSHLKMLVDAGVVQMKKSNVNSKPRTEIFLTEDGRNSFIDYLKALEEVLKNAAEAISADNKNVSFPFSWLKPVGA
jgi:DNA-binding HxlR family transcriptional regulator